MGTNGSFSGNFGTSFDEQPLERFGGAMDINYRGRKVSFYLNASARRDHYLSFNSYGRNINPNGVEIVQTSHVIRLTYSKNFGRSNIKSVKKALNSLKQFRSYPNSVGNPSPKIPGAISSFGLILLIIETIVLAAASTFLLDLNQKKATTFIISSHEKNTHYFRNSYNGNWNLRPIYLR